MNFLTDFADQAVVLPVAFIIGLGLAIIGWWRGAVAWGASVVAALGAMLMLKLVFLACGSLLTHWHIRSPSGHTAAATVIYGGAAALLGRIVWGPRLPALLPAGLIAGLIGLSRVALGAHSLAEVVVGALIGLAGALVMMLLAGDPPPGLRLGPFPIVAVAVMVALHGVHLPAERALDRFAPSIWPLSMCVAPRHA